MGPIENFSAKSVKSETMKGKGMPKLDVPERCRRWKIDEELFWKWKRTPKREKIERVTRHRTGDRIARKIALLAEATLPS